jgi:hypothetical protein
MEWARILAFVTGMVDQELLARNEYLAAENRNGNRVWAPLTRVHRQGDRHDPGPAHCRARLFHGSSTKERARLVTTSRCRERCASG